MLDPKHYSEEHGSYAKIVMQDLNENLSGTRKHNVNQAKRRRLSNYDSLSYKF